MAEEAKIDPAKGKPFGGNATHAKAESETFVHRLWANYLPMSDRAVLAASLGINLLALALPLLILQVYNRILPYEGYATLAMLALGVGMALLFDIALKLARSTLTGWAGAQYEHKAGMVALEKLATGDMAQIEAEPSGRHLDRLSSIEMIRDFYASQASLALIDIPFALVFLLVLGLIAGPLVLVPIFALAIAGFTGWAIGQSLERRIENRRDWDRRRYSFLIEVLSGIHSVKALAMEEMMQRRYERLLESNANASRGVAFVSGLAHALGAVASQVTVALVVGFGSLMAISGSLSVGALAAATLLAGRTVQPALRALGLWSRFQSISVAERNLKDIDAIPPDRRGTAVLETFETLSLRRVGFAYGPDLPRVIARADFTLRRGEVIGISGANGVGKTTLLQLVSGQLRPDEGEVLINGRPPSDYSAESLFSEIAYIPQRPTLFHGTVLDNLTMFRSHDMDILEQAIALAARLHLDHVFARMPLGYDTEVGDSAASLLPTGVAQRITIVRALVGRPKLILFDESNTALDARSDASLAALLRDLRQEAALILVSYRPSLLQLADRRYLLKNGQLVETGPRPGLSGGGGKP